MVTKRELKQLVERVTAAPGYTRLVGTRVISVDAGTVAMGVDRRPDLVQASGYFHGGVIAGLADHAAGAAVTTALPAGRFAITANLQINILAPAKGDTLVARAQAVQSGRTLGVAQIDLFVSPMVSSSGAPLKCRTSHRAFNT